MPKDLLKLLESHGYTEHIRIEKNVFALDRTIYESNKDFIKNFAPKKNNKKVCQKPKRT